MSIHTASRSFRYLSILSALLFFALAAIWLFTPATLLANWGVAFGGGVEGLIGRRAAPLYAGIGVMLFALRNAPPSAGRTAAVAGFITACLLLALLGAVEWAAGRVNAGILSAIVVEIVLPLAFVLAIRAERKGPSRR
ncbi:hypothetical protein WBW39_09515 [Pectobacterium versatile]|uniref:hypothetical protein n=1 Tax=Pectobacterium versatile TaxID=2488639 RepID=UPI000D4BAF5C|nr:MULTISPECIES: hypothetical protein [Pectobacterium]MBA0173186.1 hypothetical protein [Pectobacterium versatile]MBA0185124.1 hypothetical protein [Pectobacterium versatile]MBD0847568.1 membrane protein [Pectobacterium carotovorum subsp. carotovorum]MBK4826494.1 hypothetical protein [Pectobacterium carotovorum subsp. carotovorum]MBN3238561.1 hypothetical protein [Pectobacterium versatile]